MTATLPLQHARCRTQLQQNLVCVLGTAGNSIGDVPDDISVDVFTAPSHVVMHSADVSSTRIRTHVLPPVVDTTYFDPDAALPRGWTAAGRQYSSKSEYCRARLQLDAVRPNSDGGGGGSADSRRVFVVGAATMRRCSSV